MIALHDDLKDVRYYSETLELIYTQLDHWRNNARGNGTTTRS